jgi:transposase-like protein
MKGFPAVSLDEALAEQCPACQAEPGDPCTYEGDLFSYARGPHGRVKTLVHQRGDKLASGVHSGRMKDIKARRLAERKARGRPGGPRKAGNVPDTEIGRLYRSGMTVAEVAAAAGLSDTTTRRRLREAGVESRSRGPAPRQVPGNRDWRIVTVYLTSGKTAAEIAAKEGVSCATVFHVLRQQGVETRREARRRRARAANQLDTS